MTLHISLWCIRASAGDGDFYVLFQFAGTDELNAITSPLVADTKNAKFTLTNVLLQMEPLNANGEPSGIQVGMTVEKVVAQWGKPYRLEPHSCLRDPFFFCREVQVHFEAGSNRVQAI